MTKACNDNIPNASPPKGSSKCPICSHAVCHAYRPFCSKRCADLDLGRWLGGKYVIAADVGGEEEDSFPVSLAEGESSDN